MPHVPSTYQPKLLYRIPDANTIYAAVLRKVVSDDPIQERMLLKDGDFLDLDWNCTKGPATSHAAILLHGLAGNSKRPYMRGMARVFNRIGWDTVSMNLRGCSQETNRSFKSYHGGSSDDLAEVVQHVLGKSQYRTISLVGFSLGGNIVLKYLGEGRDIPIEVSAAAAISVPCDLEGSLEQISRKRNMIYAKRFQILLKEQLKARAQKFPEQLRMEDVLACDSLRDIDELYTSRAHGFKNADEYYEQNSSLRYLSGIRRPTLLLNAMDDPFLCDSAFPLTLAEQSKFLYLETPTFGGHLGFVLEGEEFYHERRASEFLQLHQQ